MYHHSGNPTMLSLIPTKLSLISRPNPFSKLQFIL